MTTKALQIRDAITALLTASTCGGVPATRIHKDLAFALDAGTENMPSITVELGNEQVGRSDIDILHRTVEVTVAVLSVATKGVGAADAATNADSPLRTAHNRIMADRTLGGIAFDLEDRDIRRERGILDKQVMSTEILYEVGYLTSATSLES